MRFWALYIGDDGELEEIEDQARALERYLARSGLLWVDVEEPDREARRLLEESFGFHRLSVETCLDEHIDPPKAVRHDGYLFVLLHGVDHFTESELVEINELGMFVGANFLVTCHRRPVDAVEHIRREFIDDRASQARRGADFLAHAVASTLISNVEPTVDRLGAVAERIEGEIVDDPVRVHLDVLNRLKRSALRLDRFLLPERATLRRIPERGPGIIGPECSYYFDDVADDAEYLVSRVAGIGARADIAFSTYLSVVSIRQNENLKVLSILAFVFLPLTLVAGIYGMNFEHMPELAWRYGYFLVVGVIGAALALMALWILITQRQFRREATRTLTRLFVAEPLRVSGYTAALARWPRKVASDLAATATSESSRDPRRTR